jgi:large subunit ribosomal protein L23
LNVKGKQKSFGRIRGQRSGWKKAYVALQEGENLTFANA